MWLIGMIIGGVDIGAIVACMIPEYCLQYYLPSAIVPLSDALNVLSGRNFVPYSWHIYPDPHLETESDLSCEMWVTPEDPRDQSAWRIS